MTTGTMHMGGYATGAARPGTCGTLLHRAGTAAPIATAWNGGTRDKQVSPVFPTDHPTRRQLERFP